MSIVYQAGNYIIKKTRLPKNRQYMVVNLERLDKNLHTHLRTEKESRDLVHFAINKTVPLNAKVDFLISLKRIIIDKKYIAEVEKAIENRNARRQIAR